MNDTVRFERKFILINKNISYLENLLRTSKFNFKEDYPSRKVNSIYFDDQNLTSVIDNLDGNNFKKKIRLRWYGDKKIIKSPTLEIKKKIGHVNYKKNYKMKGFKPLTFKSENINQLLKGLLEKKIPISSTHYSRLYFISSKNNIRATIDFNINYFNLQKFSNYHLNNYSKSLILEIKYSSKEDAYVRYLLKNINLRLNKNSKYINSLVENPFKIL
jgi:SPX domain protein involved in polyphosphate accumulation